MFEVYLLHFYAELEIRREMEAAEVDHGIDCLPGQRLAIGSGNEVRANIEIVALGRPTKTRHGRIPADVKTHDLRVVSSDRGFRRDLPSDERLLY
jgi:hypothetical protein